jgi:hypothetical protein
MVPRAPAYARWPLMLLLFSPQRNVACKHLAWECPQRWQGQSQQHGPPVSRTEQGV